MSDTVPDERTMAPAPGDPAETDIEPRGAEGLGFEPAEATPATPLHTGHEDAGHQDAEQERGLDDAPVFDSESATSYRMRWSAILTEFIDDPHRAVENADRFVATVAQAFASGVERRRQGLSSAWQHDGHDQTEDLRLVMRQYRTLVDQMLTVAATHV